MIPLLTSSIFKSRWMALVWATAILWFAYDFAAPSDNQANSTDNAVEITDATGAPVSTDEARRLGEALNRV